MIGMPMPTHPAIFAIRRYQPDDHDGWVRCRVLSFLDTQYYDDVRPSRSTIRRSHSSRPIPVTAPRPL